MGFFMRGWKSGMAGAVKMGAYHGLYCLGCCWPYFLLMVALGWMNLLWMALFAAIIFGEKVWIKGGRWIAKSAGAGFVILGVLALIGIIEVPTGDMTMTDIDMDKSMNTEIEMDMGNTNHDNNMQMNTKGNDMVMNMK
jgi:hypothetical protein